ncbi:MAG: spore coat protein CotJB [Ruminococcaceae bacterium]|nr:spore coat protein CotJB [Oscillospiraceae bacterium]
MNATAMTSCGLRRRIAAYDFALVEMNLYLDTHPCDKEALELMYAYRRKRAELVEVYEQHFGPYEVTARKVENPDRWSWVDAPWPWEIA